MRPYPEEVLKAIQTGIGAHFAPELQSNYARAQLAFSMLLFTIAQRDYDTAVPDVIEHNKELRALLADARAALDGLQHPEAASARAALDALPLPAQSLKLSDLRGEREALRAAVCALVPLIEPAADDPPLAALRDIRSRVYAYLTADSRKRIVPILTV